MHLKTRWGCLAQAILYGERALLTSCWLQRLFYDAADGLTALSTVEGLPDAEVCIGDQYRVSEAVRRSMRAFARDIMPAIAAW